MKTTFTRGVVTLLGLWWGMPVLRAHPGHDGHELTWDFSHLAAHPLATVGWVAAITVAGGLGWYWVRRSAAARFHNFRGSQPSRGK